MVATLVSQELVIGQVVAGHKTVVCHEQNGSRSGLMVHRELMVGQEL
jgi:hypothetical protein